MRDVAAGEKTIRLLLELNQPEAATRMARKVGTLGTRGKCVLADFLAQRGDPGDEAFALVRAAADAGDTRAAAETALGIATLPAAGPRWRDLADHLLDRARKDEPGANDLIEKQALLRHHQGKFAEEVALYRELLGRQPESYQFLNNMAWTLSEELGDPKEGLNRADEALEKLGPEPHLLDTRGVILTRLGRLDDAIRDLEAAAEALPSGTIDFHLARAYQMKGQADKYEKARACACRARLTPERLQPSECGRVGKGDGGLTRTSCDPARRRPKRRGGSCLAGCSPVVAGFPLQ